jgi:hypothetical protein
MRALAMRGDAAAAALAAYDQLRQLLREELGVFELSRVLYPTRLRRVTGGGNAPATRP